MFQGFFLGIAAGTSCLAYCAPVLLPFFLGEGRTVRGNFTLLIQFLAGRLGGYLLFGLAAWQVGQWVQKSGAHALFMGITYLVLAVLLVTYGFRTPKPRCAAETGNRWLAQIAGRFPSLLPAILGLLTGLTLCPPFLAAFADASGRASVGSSVAYFAAFFMGTALFFVPLPFTGVLRRFNPIRIVGRLVCGIVGIAYLYKGAVLLYTGFLS